MTQASRPIRVLEMAMIGKEIDRILELAENIGLMAAGAMLAARQSGTGAAGLSVAERELQMCKDCLVATMADVECFIDRIAESEVDSGIRHAGKHSGV